MTTDFATIQRQACEWLEAGHDAGWVEKALFERFRKLEAGTSDDLFAAGQPRPLVVALFGGTGVGKSSLLNRFAKREVARVGVERPTSTEVTVYLHHDVALNDLPANLPLDRVQVKRHGDTTLRDYLWLDAPDIDSTTVENRATALAWLPHVDLLVYVVSPERYRDDAGWRILLERGHRHGWLFVMNRFDQGAPAQRDDFLRQVRAAGFDMPLVYTTACQPGTHAHDQFQDLQQALRAVVDAHGVRELTRLGHRARLTELRRVLQQAADQLGNDRAWEKIAEDVPAAWEATRRTLVEGLNWPIRSLSARVTARERGMTGGVRGVIEKIAGASSAAANNDEQLDPSEFLHLAENVWDDWAAEKLTLRLDAVELQTRTTNIAVNHLRKRLDAIGADARNVVLGRMQDELRAALAWTGAGWQRWLRAVTGFLMVVLPFAALSTVLFVLVTGYFSATTGPAGYPGTDFAVASGLLVLVSWAVPFWADRLLKPSVGRAVQRGLTRGLEQGLNEIGERLDDAIADSWLEVRTQRDAVEKLLKQLASVLVKPIRADRDEIARLVASRRGDEATTPPDRR